jgi:hypothetical protein
MIIKVYIGAHKTATTHIQSILEYNQDALSSNNIKLSTPKKLRPSWLKIFMDYCHNNNLDNIKQLKDEAPKDGIWILSDENISGTPYEFMIINKGIYPHIKNRLKCLKKLFPDAKIELFFALRSYDTFYRSIYLEIIRNQGYIPFQEFYNKEKFNQNSWKNVITMFTDVIPEENINLWLYEDTKKIIPKILNSITTLNNPEELISNYPVINTRPSLSKKALEVLSSFYPIFTQEESKKIVEEINQKYPISKKYPKFIAFDNIQTKEFQKKYLIDIEAINNCYPKINFIKEYRNG